MECPAWAASGECARNPDFMRASCPKNCAGDGAAPIVLRGAAKGWRPYEAWDGEGLSSAAGDDEVELTLALARALALALKPIPGPNPNPSPSPYQVEVGVVERAGIFEVHADRIERPPKSSMRIADLVRRCIPNPNPNPNPSPNPDPTPNRNPNPSPD